MKYVYTGPGPIPDPEGEIVRPGDEREYAEQPTWGVWDPVGQPEEPERPPMAYTPVIGGKAITDPVTAENDYAAAPPVAPKEM